MDSPKLVRSLGADQIIACEVAGPKLGVTVAPAPDAVFAKLGGLKIIDHLITPLVLFRSTAQAQEGSGST